MLIGLVLRGAASMTLQHEAESDELAYLSMAQNLLGGLGIVDFMGNRAMYSVGYPLFIVAPAFALFGSAPFAIPIANALLGALAIALCYALAKQLGAGPIGRNLAAAMWALYLPASVYSAYAAKENLMIPLMLGVMLCVVRLARAPSSAIAAGCGVLFGLLALVGNAALSLGAAALVALLLAPVALPRKLSLALLLALGAGVVVAPWLLRNAQVLGAPVLNTNGGFNFYLGNNPAATGWFVSIADTPRGATWNELRKQGEAQASATLRQEALAWIEQHPAQFASLALRKLVYFWTPPWHEGKGRLAAAEDIVRALWLLQFLLIAAAALATLFVQRLRTHALGLMWLAIAAYSAVHMLFYVIVRYREPIMPLLCVLAALAIEPIARRYLCARRASA